MLLSACGRSPDESTLPAALWSCGGLEFAAYAVDGGIELHLPGYTEVLAPVDDAGGRRFERGEFALALAEASAELTVAGTAHQCQPKQWDVPWQAARERGATFRAIGQEPGWHVEVVPDGALTLVLDYGERTLTAPAPAVTPLDGGARGYQIEADGRVVQLVIEDLTCFDVMSGQVFPETATVAVDGRRYAGCGVPLG